MQIYIGLHFGAMVITQFNTESDILPIRILTLMENCISVNIFSHQTLPGKVKSAITVWTLGKWVTDIMTSGYLVILHEFC